jgi:hypothetical protein
MGYFLAGGIFADKTEGVIFDDGEDAEVGFREGLHRSLKDGRLHPTFHREETDLLSGRKEALRDEATSTLIPLRVSQVHRFDLFPCRVQVPSKSY